MHVQGESYLLLFQSKTFVVPHSARSHSTDNLEASAGSPETISWMLQSVWGSVLDGSWFSASSFPEVGAVMCKKQRQGGNGGLQHRVKIPHHTCSPDSFSPLCSHGDLKLPTTCKERKTEKWMGDGWHLM